MKIHFCCDMDGWVLERTARLILPHIPGATIGEEVRSDADVNVYFPYYRLQAKGPSLDAALFTHRETDDSETSQRKREWWDGAVELADWCFGMSRQTLALLPQEKSSLLELPADPSLRLGRKVRFGVCGRSYQSGRKRTDWVAQLSTLPGTEWYFTEGRVPQEKMPGFFAHIDYLVVASENEGGPLPLKEAMACGKPVIAPDVGWSWDYPVIRYEGYEGLLNVVRKLTPKDETKDAARALYSALWRFKEAA